MHAPQRKLTFLGHMSAFCSLTQWTLQGLPDEHVWAGGKISGFQRRGKVTGGRGGAGGGEKRPKSYGSGTQAPPPSVSVTLGTAQWSAGDYIHQKLDDEVRFPGECSTDLVEPFEELSARFIHGQIKKAPKAPKNKKNTVYFERIISVCVSMYGHRENQNSQYGSTLHIFGDSIELLFLHMGWGNPITF